MGESNALANLKEFAEMSDLEFYERFLEDAPLEELAEFCREFPDFLEDAREADQEYGDLDSERMLAKIMQKIKNYEKSTTN